MQGCEIDTVTLKEDGFIFILQNENNINFTLNDCILENIGKGEYNKSGSFIIAGIDNEAGNAYVNVYRTIFRNIYLFTTITDGTPD